ncbi:MAG: ArsB/NhaD family transporter [Kiritimatiellae bacterium]|jgi:Na+/H+ antiporter NhaD/arsenite permease-like protein|nr:ArsB/NhaD family transporter [Kiritimatiellia bacterium]
MLLPIIIFLVVYFFIATELIDKTIAAVIGAGLMIGFHFIGYEEALQAIDMNVLFLLIGMMIVVSILTETGVFEWLAIKLAQLAKGNGLLLAILFMILTAVLSAFLDNVTTVILMAPITILLCQLLEIPAVPILIMEAIFSNIGGTATLVGDPPNILIGSQTRLSFNDFLINLSPPVIVMLIILLGVMSLLLHKSIRTTAQTRKRIEQSRPERAILQPLILKKALIVFGCILTGFFAGRALDIEPGIIALAGAMVMVLVCKKDLHYSLRSVEWNTILFFAGLFMMIATLEHHDVFKAMGEFILNICNGNLMATVLTILWFSAFASAIVDNIPLVMAMIPLVTGIIPIFATQMGISDPALIHSQIAEPLLWALALGACLGGNGTLVGASANIVISQVANRNNCKISFFSFTKYGFPFMLVSLIIAHIYLYLKYFM